MKPLQVHLVNPLPRALAHYEAALVDNLQAGGIDVNRVTTTSMEVASGGPLSKGASVVRSILERWGLLRARRGLVLCVWPGFGLLEFLTWLVAALRHHVAVVYHDPVPIRRQAGYSRPAGIAFSWCARWIPRFHVVAHTTMASRDLWEVHRVRAEIAYHPILPFDGSRVPASAPAAVTVLGQFKPERSLEPLEDIARAAGSKSLTLQIKGRGWPDVPGWRVDDTFLSEDDFDACVDAAMCVVIPYARFYQSGVATRCLERGTPVLAPRHENIEWLFGSDWVGLVDDGHWAAALHRVLHQTPNIAGRADLVRQQAVESWVRLVRGATVWTQS